MSMNFYTVHVVLFYIVIYIAIIVSELLLDSYRMGGYNYYHCFVTARQ